MILHNDIRVVSLELIIIPRVDLQVHIWCEYLVRVIRTKETSATYFYDVIQFLSSHRLAELQVTYRGWETAYQTSQSIRLHQHQRNIIHQTCTVRVTPTLYSTINYRLAPRTNCRRCLQNGVAKSYDSHTSQRHLLTLIHFSKIAWHVTSRPDAVSRNAAITTPLFILGMALTG